MAGWRVLASPLRRGQLGHLPRHLPRQLRILVQLEHLGALERRPQRGNLENLEQDPPFLTSTLVWRSCWRIYRPRSTSNGFWIGHAGSFLCVNKFFWGWELFTFSTAFAVSLLRAFADVVVQGYYGLWNTLGYWVWGIVRLSVRRRCLGSAPLLWDLYWVCV